MKMTAAQLEDRIREGIEKLSLHLGHDGYHCDGTVCAIGGALAYAAASRQQLDHFISQMDDSGRLSGHNAARTAAKILNHNLTPRDMVMLEAGYEGDLASSYAQGKDACYGIRIALNLRNPYYRLGRKLRQESLGKQKEA